MQCHKVRTQRCHATRTIRRRFGLKNALDYLVGEKLLNFAEAADGIPSLPLSFHVFRPPCGRSLTPMSLPATWLLSGP